MSHCAPKVVVVMVPCSPLRALRYLRQLLPSQRPTRARGNREALYTRTELDS